MHVKDIDSHTVRALLASRALLVKIKRDLEDPLLFAAFFKKPRSRHRPCQVQMSSPCEPRS